MRCACVWLREGVVWVLPSQQQVKEDRRKRIRGGREGRRETTGSYLKRRSKINHRPPNPVRAVDVQVAIPGLC